MFWYSIFAAFIYACLNIGLATTYLPIPLSEQLKGSSGIVLGIFKSKIYKKVKGEVVTEYSFILSETIGVKKNKIVNKNNFKVVLPGGLWQGQKYETVGGPDFNKDEEVALILKGTPLGLTVKGLALGKYNVIRKGPDVYVSNYAFPNHSSLGKIKMNKFKSILNDYYKSRGFSEKYEESQIGTITHSQKSSSSKYQNRGPASLDTTEETQGPDSENSLFWPAVMFALFGAFSTFYSKRYSRKK